MHPRQSMEQHMGRDAPRALRAAVVHADELMRLALRHVLEHEGLAQVLLETDEPEVVELRLRKEPLDLAVFQLRAPVRPTLEVMSRIHQWYPRTGLLVLGELTPGLVHGAVEAGAHAVLNCNASCQEFWRASGTVGSGAMHVNAWMEGQLRGPGRTARHEAQRHGIRLTPRQMQVLRLLCHPAGLTHEKIAQRLGIGKRTVDEHVAVLFEKFKVNSRSALIVKAKEMHMI